MTIFFYRQLEYRKTFDKEMKGKGWKFTKDTPSQKHVEEIGQVQSQVSDSFLVL